MASYYVASMGGKSGCADCIFFFLLFLVHLPLLLVVFFPCHLSLLRYAQKSSRSLSCGTPSLLGSSEGSWVPEQRLLYHTQL